MQDSYRKENETEENNRISRYTVIDKLGKGRSGKGSGDSENGRPCRNTETARLFYS